MYYHALGAESLRENTLSHLKFQFLDYALLLIDRLTISVSRICYFFSNGKWIMISSLISGSGTAASERFLRRVSKFPTGSGISSTHRRERGDQEGARF